MGTESHSPAVPPLSGAVLVLIQFDVCEEIRLDRIQTAAAAIPGKPI